MNYLDYKVLFEKKIQSDPDLLLISFITLLEALFIYLVYCSFLA
jgi:hypothetical protein